VSSIGVLGIFFLKRFQYKNNQELNFDIFPMTETEFWALIEKSKRKIKNDREEQTEFLANHLSQQPEEEIFSFAGHFGHFYRQSYTSHLWCVAYIAMGGCSDDGFDYFRAWLISQGKETFQNALQDPDSLLVAFDKLRKTEEDGYPEFEEMLSVPLEAYRKKKGVDDSDEEKYEEIADEYYDKLGQRVSFEPFPEIKFDWSDEDEESMKKICPNVFAKHWEDPFA
jgi:hypothetical protein